MKKLILLSLIMTSCGSVEIPLFEKHLGKDKHDDSATTSQAVVAHVPSSRPFICSQQSWQEKCSIMRPTNVVLYHQSFYSPYCYQRYTNCLQFGRR